MILRLIFILFFLIKNKIINRNIIIGFNRFSLNLLIFKVLYFLKVISIYYIFII